MKTKEQLRKELLSYLDSVSFMQPDAIPGIDLYMDQVTTFMDQQLSSGKRYPEDKLLTKTMINNYAKNDLLPSPEKKKYSRDHLILLAYIYYLKGFLSISDIQALLNPLTEKYFKDESDHLLDIYCSIMESKKGEMEALKEDVTACFQKSEKAFQDYPEEDREYLQLLSLISMLSFEVYIKKQLIEHMIDDLRSAEAPAEKKKSGKEKK